MEQQEKRTDKKSILIFLGLTFVITYAVEIAIIWPMATQASASGDPSAQAMITTLIAGVMFVPAICVLLTKWVTKERFSQGIYLNFNFKSNLKYYIFAWFGMAGLIVAGAVIYFLIFPAQFDINMGYLMNVMQSSGQEMTVSGAQQMIFGQFAMGLIIAPLANFVNCIGEEFGWRGYLLPRLQKYFKTLPLLLISGVIWGLWHAPLTAIGHNYSTGYWGFPVTGIIAMCLFCIVVGTVFSYITIKTRSCLPAVFAHGMLNGLSSMGIFFNAVDQPYNVFLGPMPVGLIGGSGFIVCAVFFALKLRKEENITGI